MAAALALRLRRLAAMRDAAAILMDRPQLGRDVFAAGAAEGLPVHEEALHEGTLVELLRAYAAHRIRRKPRGLLIELSAYHSMEDAYKRLTQLLGSTPDWEILSAFCPAALAPRAMRPRARASRAHWLRRWSLRARASCSFASWNRSARSTSAGGGKRHDRFARVVA